LPSAKLVEMVVIKGAITSILRVCFQVRIRSRVHNDSKCTGSSVFADDDTTECMVRESRSRDSVDIFRFLLSLNFSPYGWQIRQHLREAALDGFYRKFPAVRAIYFAHDYTNDVDKRLQGSTSLVGFVVMIIGWWKEAVDMTNDLFT